MTMHGRPWDVTRFLFITMCTARELEYAES